MLHLCLPALVGPRRLAFYLAMEEWAAMRMGARSHCFFSWRVAPTVICGRNQQIAKEVDVEMCRRLGVDIVRRRSGGGCVYADMDNLMMSYIGPNDGSATDMLLQYSEMVAQFLNSLGINAQVSGRNDITVDGKKISGNAFYHLPTRSIAHGTMLFDFDPAVLGRILTPSRAKVESKGVKSVPARVTSLHEQGLEMDIETFRKAIARDLCSGEYWLSEDDLEEINAIEQRYYDPAYLRIDREDIVPTYHIPGVGEIGIALKTDGTQVADIALFGDFFCGYPQALEKFYHSLIGCILDSLPAKVLENYPDGAIRGLDAAALSHIFEKHITYTHNHGKH